MKSRGNVLKELHCPMYIFIQDCCLVVDYAYQQYVAHYIQCFINEVESILLLIITKNEFFLLKIRAPFIYPKQPSPPGTILL